MKPLIVSHILHSFGTGGMEKGVATLVSHSSKDVNHIIICLSRSGNSERLLPPGTQLIEMDKLPGHSYGFYRRLSCLLKDLGPDVVHTRNWGGTDGILAARMAGIRSVVHSEHGFGPENPDGNIAKRIWTHRLLSPMVKEYIALSSALQQWLSTRVKVLKPVHQIINGVDVKQFCPGSGSRIRQSLGIHPDTFVIGVAASLNTIKDHPTLIKAFKKFKKQQSDAVLLIAGDGPERETLEQLSGPGIIFLGNRNDIPEFMQALDLFVLSSINEGISNTILEAMASGLPVAATLVGGNPELVIRDVTGKLFPAGDSEALAAILSDYAVSPELRKNHGENGRKTVVDQFSIQTMVDKYETVWRRIAKTGSS